MRRIMFAASIFVLAVFALSAYYSKNPANVNGQAPSGESTQVPLVQSTQDSVATNTPTITIVPATSMVTATSVPETPTPFVIEPTLDPLLLVDIETLTVNVKPEAIAFHPVLKQIVQVLDYQEGAKVSGTVLDTDLGDVPELSELGPPALPGDTTYLTGYDWLGHKTHWAIDIANGRMIFGSPTKAKVYAVLWEEAAYKYGSSGWNVIVIAKIPQGYGMEGWLLFGTGHLKQDVPVQVGQIIEAGDALGNIGMTGDPKWGITGPHMHYYVVWLKTDGTTEFLDPNNWNALGTR